MRLVQCLTFVLSVLVPLSMSIGCGGGGGQTPDGGVDGDVEDDADVGQDADFDGPPQTGFEYRYYTFDPGSLDVFGLGSTYHFYDPCGSTFDGRSVLVHDTVGEASRELFDLSVITEEYCGRSLDASAGGQRFAMTCGSGVSVVVDQSGAVIQKLSVEGTAQVLISDDGALAAVTADEGISIVDLSTGDGEPELLVAGGSDPAIAPDNDRIAYVDETGLQIRVVDIATGEITVVTSIDTEAMLGLPLTWSNDGSSIYFHIDNVVYVVTAEEGATMEEYYELSGMYALGSYDPVEVSYDGRYLLFSDMFNGYIVLSVEDGAVYFYGSGSYLCG